MHRIKFSVRSFFALLTCAMLIALTAYERDRAYEIEARSMVLSNREYRAIVEQDWQILNRELQLHLAKEQFENNQALVEGELIPNSARRDLANLRNSELKLALEKAKLATCGERL